MVHNLKSCSRCQDENGQLPCAEGAHNRDATSHCHHHPSKTTTKDMPIRLDKQYHISSVMVTSQEKASLGSGDPFDFDTEKQKAD